ncbi:hypothetical protein ANO14919_048170 [Xylariales sp. No.14919]|nr:hypothetical protein ANO14919_048170 [Xylariales sp. No.14919]
MGGHEARTFMKWTVGADSSSKIKRDHDTNITYAERPKRKSSSSKRQSSSDKQSSSSSSYCASSLHPSDSASQPKRITR